MSSPVIGSSSTPETERPQAGPLPSKRGEIGFVESTHAVVDNRTPVEELPARHPADRDGVAQAVASTTSVTSPPTGDPAAVSANPDAMSSVNSIVKQKKIFAVIKLDRLSAFNGLRVATLLIFVAQVLLFSGTIVGWVFTARRVAQAPSAANQSVMTGITSAIFIHVIFAIATLIQLLFLERRVFRMRAERYSFQHPGEILPRYRGQATADTSFSISPWNRPPLPTYAATLSQSGAGTGDVEDHLIAAPPPPAYGNTRGSTLLLAGLLRDSLRAQRPLSGRSGMSSSACRPSSYRSRDEDWQESQDVDRARRLDETLAQLERSTSRA